MAGENQNHRYVRVTSFIMNKLRWAFHGFNGWDSPRYSSTPCVLYKDIPTSSAVSLRTLWGGFTYFCLHGECSLSKALCSQSHSYHVAFGHLAICSHFPKCHVPTQGQFCIPHLTPWTQRTLWSMLIILLMSASSDLFRFSSDKLIIYWNLCNFLVINDMMV
jgi:hypothetical protein